MVGYCLSLSRNGAIKHGDKISIGNRAIVWIFGYDKIQTLSARWYT